VQVTRAKAIKVHCFDCAGESNKEVTLCVVFDCPLWQFRTGQSLNSAVYKSRMMTAKTNYAEDLAEMDASGIETSRFWRFSCLKSASVAKKSRQSSPDTQSATESKKRTKSPILSEKGTF
jgi:hypothetical protein